MKTLISSLMAWTIVFLMMAHTALPHAHADTEPKAEAHHHHDAHHHHHHHDDEAPQDSDWNWLLSLHAHSSTVVPSTSVAETPTLAPLPLAPVAILFSDLAGAPASDLNHQFRYPPPDRRPTPAYLSSYSRRGPPARLG